MGGGETQILGTLGHAYFCCRPHDQTRSVSHPSRDWLYIVCTTFRRRPLPSWAWCTQVLSSAGFSPVPLPQGSWGFMPPRPGRPVGVPSTSWKIHSGQPSDGRLRGCTPTPGQCALLRRQHRPRPRAELGEGPVWGWRGPPHRDSTRGDSETLPPRPSPRLLSPRPRVCVWTQLANIRLPPAPARASRPQIDAGRRRGSHVLAFQGRFPSWSIPSRYFSSSPPGSLSHGKCFPFIRHFNVHSTYITIWVGTCIKLRPQKPQTPITATETLYSTSKVHYISLCFACDSLNGHKRSKRTEVCTSDLSTPSLDKTPCNHLRHLRQSCDYIKDRTTSFHPGPLPASLNTTFP